MNQAPPLPSQPPSGMRKLDSVALKSSVYVVPPSIASTASKYTSISSSTQDPDGQLSNFNFGEAWRGDDPFSDKYNTPAPNNENGNPPRVSSDSMRSVRYASLAPDFLPPTIPSSANQSPAFPRTPNTFRTMGSRRTKGVSDPFDLDCPEILGYGDRESRFGR